MRLSTITAKYRSLFAIDEIEREPILQWFFGAMLFFFFLTFSRFIGTPLANAADPTHNSGTCWPFIQGCAHLSTLIPLPYGYTQSEFYMIIYAAMLYIVYLMWRKDWTHAHVLMTALWLWKMVVIFMLNYLIAGPYDYYHLIFTAILLFVPFKVYFSKFMFVFLYFMSVTPKFDETWTLGTYFTAMKTGLPLFPTALTPLFTNLVIAFQVIGCWYLLSAKRLYQRLALIFATIFHVYSGILVYYLYPSISLPPLLILFGPMYRHTPTPFSKKSVAGWCIVLFVALFQLAGFLISPDRRITLEGNRYGMFMFEANHQCIATISTYSRNAQVASTTNSTLSCSGLYCLTQTSTHMDGADAVEVDRYESGSAWNRCDPYPWWAKLHNLCTGNIQRIAFQFDHSVDGGPFYRIIDLPNICDVTYQPFMHNRWIMLPPQARVIGYPVENYYNI